MPRRSKWMHLVAGVVAGVTLGVFLKLCLKPSSRTSIEACVETAKLVTMDPLALIDMSPDETIENSNRSLVFVGVMTAEQYLSSRAKAVMETWAQDLPGRIAFFSSESSRAPGLPLVPLRGVDDSYPPQKKSFLMILYMYEKYGDKFEWFMRADDDVYVRGDKLSEFLRSVDSRKPQFIGQAGRGTNDERDALALDYNENFCMGGPGVLLSRETLRRVAPHVKYCLKHLYTTHEDVELGRCVAKFAGVSCTWSYDKEADKAIARAVYVTGLPLSIFEHPLWKRALQLLRPDYNPPSRKILSTVLLDEEYDEMKRKVTEKIEEANVLHLAADGWTNIKKDSIVNIIIYTPKPFFHSSIDTQNNRHTAEYLSEKIGQTMDEIGPEKFVSIVTDNAANMKKCGKLLNEQYENTTWVGCLAHTLNLLVSDVLKIEAIQEINRSVVAIVKSILHSNVFSAEFKKIAAEKSLDVSLLFPVKTRWGSYLHCLENFLKSKSILQTMVVNEENRDLQKHRSNILDENTWKDIEKQITFFKPIVKWITILEGDCCTIHLVHRALKEIEDILDGECSSDIMDDLALTNLKLKFQIRRQNCVKPIHLAAVILDPRNQGSTLSHDEYLDGCSTIMDTARCDNNLIQELSDYKCRKGIWERSFVWQKAGDVDPISWWETLFPKTELTKTARKILSIPSTSASVERSFSTYGNIHTKKRNKLKNERAAKLCFIAHNWKLMNKTSLAPRGENPRHQINIENDNTDSLIDAETSWDLSSEMSELENVDFRSVTDLNNESENFDTNDF